MKCNVGGMDKTGRFVLAAVLVGIGLLAPLETGWRIAMFVLAGVAVVTATIGSCPLNALLGINTCKKPT